jgi:hypothetical protein
MGCDVFGYVEFNDPEDGWTKAITIGAFIDRNYDVYGCLWGFRNGTHFRPLIGDSEHITYKHIREADWDEEAEDLDERITVFNILENGEEEWSYKVGKETNMITDEERKHLAFGGSVELINGAGRLQRCRRELHKRKDILPDKVNLLFSLMELLANEYGDENVRMKIDIDY